MNENACQIYRGDALRYWPMQAHGAKHTVS